jgi:hypothetical protein
VVAAALRNAVRGRQAAAGVRSMSVVKRWYYEFERSSCTSCWGSLN